MNKKTRAKLLILEVQALQDGNYENRTDDLLTLVNEVVRDAKALAEDTIADSSDDLDGKKKAA
jgi:hypothetical protein